jgi:hypothetical protein
MEEDRIEKGEGQRAKGKGRREKGEGRREKGEGRREKGEGGREKMSFSPRGNHHLRRRAHQCNGLLSAVHTLVNRLESYTTSATKDGNLRGDCDDENVCVLLRWAATFG